MRKEKRSLRRRDEEKELGVNFPTNGERGTRTGGQLQSFV
jgi:hypothetical protein